MKKLLSLAIALGAGWMVVQSGDPVKAEPPIPGLEACRYCNVYVYKDTNADNVYDTRVQPGLTTQPDAQTDYYGLWKLGPSSVEQGSDLYIVIEPNFERQNLLIGGDLKYGAYPTGTALNGIRTAMWEDTSQEKGVFGDAGDFRYDYDDTKCGYGSPYCGDYRLWKRQVPVSTAIVLHVDNRTSGYADLYGWVWDNSPFQLQKPLPNQ